VDLQFRERREGQHQIDDEIPRDIFLVIDQTAEMVEDCSEKICWPFCSPLHLTLVSPIEELFDQSSLLATDIKALLQCLFGLPLVFLEEIQESDEDYLIFVVQELCDFLFFLQEGDEVKNDEKVLGIGGLEGEGEDLVEEVDL
jgi:hypothetical protein